MFLISDGKLCFNESNYSIAKCLQKIVGIPPKKKKKVLKFIAFE